MLMDVLQIRVLWGKMVHSTARGKSADYGIATNNGMQNKFYTFFGCRVVSSSFVKRFSSYPGKRVVEIP